MPTEHAVFLVRDGEIGIDPEEAERRDFSQQRGQSRAADAHFGQTGMAENQGPIEKDVDHRHDDGRIGDDARIADADIERAKQEVEHHKHNAELPEPQILPSSRIDIFRLDDDMEQLVAEKEQDREKDDAQAQDEHRPMLKHHADFLVVALAEASRDKDLNADGKSHRQGCEDEIIQACHHGGTQLNGAEVPQESGVGKGDDGLRQVPQHDGIGDAPDFAIGDGCLEHLIQLKMIKIRILSPCRQSHQNISA